MSETKAPYTVDEPVDFVTALLQSNATDAQTIEWLTEAAQDYWQRLEASQRPAAMWKACATRYRMLELHSLRSEAEQYDRMQQLLHDAGEANAGREAALCHAADLERALRRIRRAAKAVLDVNAHANPPIYVIAALDNLRNALEGGEE